MMRMRILRGIKSGHEEEVCQRWKLGLIWGKWLKKKNREEKNVKLSSC